MKQILTIFGFTFINAARKKAFIISTVIIILLIGVAAAMPGILASISAQKGTSSDDQRITQVCYYIDENELLPNGIHVLSEYFQNTEFIKGSAANLDSYSSEAENNGNTSIIVVTPTDDKPFIEVITKDFRKGIPVSEVVDVLSRSYVGQTLLAQGVEAEAIAIAQSSLPFSSETLNVNDLTGYFLGILVTMLVFFAIYFYSYGVSMSVAGDRTSRVMETLVVAAKPSRILIGKCLGMGMLGLTQFSAIIFSGFVFYKLFIPEEFAFVVSSLFLSLFTFKTVALLLVYFILGYTLYSMMNAVCGAVVSKIEDLNSAMMPVMLVAIVSFYIGFFSATSNTYGLMQKIALYVPFSSAFYVPSKLISGELSGMQVAVSISILLVTIVISTIISIRIYSATVLNYGKGASRKTKKR